MALDLTRPADATRPAHTTLSKDLPDLRRPGEVIAAGSR